MTKWILEKRLMNKILLDTNILIYALDRRSQFHKPSRNLLIADENNCFTTAKNVSEYLAVVTRLPKNPLTTEVALSAIEALFEYVTVLHSTNSSFILFKEWLNKLQPTGLRIHDFEIASIGVDHGIKTIATYNERDFQDIPDLRILIPPAVPEAE